MTVTAAVAPSHAQGLGDESSIWFKLTPLLSAPGNPMHVLMQMAERYGPVIQVRLGNQRVTILNEPEHFKQVLVGKADTYVKYFDGLRPVFGHSMITLDGALWQKIRAPQHAAFHPDMFAQYVPYFLAAIRAKMAAWESLAQSGETVEMVEQTWTLAADMICKALFDRDMPFNPHVVFKCVKTYTDVMNHKSIRSKVQGGEAFEIEGEDAAKAMETWGAVPDLVMNADPREHRERTLLAMIQAAVADPNVPEFDHAQAVDELKQYLWAGTETTALTLAWALYETSRDAEASRRVREEGERVWGDREPTAADYAGLTYTRAVIQEIMRLYPPIWGLIRVAAAADTIGDKAIEPGDRIMMFAYGAHHNKKYWDDPEAFNPDRWLGTEAKKRKPYTYLPFGAGKRACIGGAMSQVENTLALSMLLRRFEPQYVGPTPPGVNATVTLTPKGGLHFKIKTRG